MVAWLCGTVLAFAFLLGGGTHTGFLGDVFVQLLSIPLLAVSLWSAFDSTKSGGHKRGSILFFGCAVVLLIAVQLFPLPFELPPIRGVLTAKALDLTSNSWSSLSQSPQATWAAGVSLIVPAAIFIATAQLELHQRLSLTWLLLGLGGLALVLGFFQMAQGPSGSLRFYDVTNASEAVGFFANRNHFAAGLYVTLVLGALWYISTARQLLQTAEATSRSVLWLTTAALFLVCVVAGLAMARSRAGVILAMAALIGIVLMVLRERNDGEDSKLRSRITVGRMSIMTVLFAAIFAAQFGLGSIMSRFEGDQLEELRVPLARTTLETALQSLPFGVGLGSFVPVYATVEKDKDILGSYANRAHNDLAEIFLETGVFGLLLLLAFFLWFFPKAWKVWLKPDGGKQSVQVRLQRAATLIIMLLLAHSLVDYPLRTTALASLFAFFCAILATEAPGPQAGSIQPARQRAAPRKPELQGMPGEKWGADLQWPESWQRRVE